MSLPTMLLQALCAGVATAMFCILFNVRGASLLLGGLNGMMGFFIQLALRGFGPMLSMFCASAAMALFAEVAARVRKAPATLFLVAGLIPLVPGGGMFDCVLKLLEGQTTEAVTTAVNTLLQAGAIATGIIVASSLLKLLPTAKRGVSAKKP